VWWSFLYRQVEPPFALAAHAHAQNTVTAASKPRPNQATIHADVRLRAVAGCGGVAGTGQAKKNPRLVRGATNRVESVFIPLVEVLMRVEQPSETVTDFCAVPLETIVVLVT